MIVKTWFQLAKDQVSDAESLSRKILNIFIVSQTWFFTDYHDEAYQNLTSA